MTRPHYPSDLTDAQWQLLKPLLPPAKRGGRPRKTDLRAVVDGIFYVLRSGCAWRMLPHDFPPWGTVHYYFWKWRRDGLWEKLNDALRRRVREAAGRDPKPTAGCLDSQTVKVADQAGPRGHDAGKKITGRKRHVVTDMLGMVLAVSVTSAAVQDYEGAKGVLEKLYGRFGRLEVLWADSIYACKRFQHWVRCLCRFVVRVVSRPPGAKGFVLLPKRWVVERTFGWLVRYRRLVKDYECDPEASESMVYAAMVHLMLRRLRPTLD